MRCFKAWLAARGAMQRNSACEEASSAPINSRLNVVVRSPAPFGLGRNGCWTFRGSQLPRALPFIFSLCCPLNDRRRAAHSFFQIGRLFSLFLFSCPSFALLCLLILLLLLMSGNVHPSPGPIFPCSVCAGNVTWRGKSAQCCTCSKWVHLRYSQLSWSQLRALGSSHSWSCPPAESLWLPPRTPPTCIPPLCNLAPPPLLTLHSRPTLVSKPLIPHLPIIYLLLLPPQPSFAPGCPSAPPASTPPDSLRVLQWNAGGLWARSTELLHFLSSHPVNLICIQEFNLNSSSSFRIPGLSALHSDRTHFRSGVLSSDTTHASGGVIIFDRQGLSFSELSTSSLSSLDPYSDYVEINISLNNSSSLSFLNMYALPIRSSPTDGRTDSFFSSIFPSSKNLFILGEFNCHTPSETQELLRTPRWGNTRLGHLLWPPLPQCPWHTHPSPSLFWQSLLSWYLLCLLFFCPFLLLGGATGPWFWPPTNFSIYSSLSGLSPQRAPPILQFSESSLGWLCLLHWLSLSFSRGILVSFSFLCYCSLYLSGTKCGQIFHSFRSHQTPF